MNNTLQAANQGPDPPPPPPQPPPPARQLYCRTTAVAAFFCSQHGERLETNKH